MANGGNQRVAPYAARRCAGVIFLTVDLDAKRPLALHAGHDPDGLARALDNGSLFDVHFQKSRRLTTERPALQLRFSREHFMKLGFDTDAVLVANAENVLKFPCACKYRRSHHAGSKARAFLIHPGDHVDGSARAHTVRDNRFDAFQPSQDAERAVELPPGRLAVDVRTDHDRR